MKYVHILRIFWAQTVFGADNLSGTVSRRDLDFMALAKHDGYIAEQHSVTTDDGYVLSLFRIPLKPNCTSSKGVIIFMHGLVLSSDDCLVPGPGKAHCYIYSDNCYDVWAPNVRGNYYSRKHKILNPDKDLEFWDFTFDDMALHDLPTIIDYVLETTNQTQVSYVAHSQGVTLLLVLCSKKPEYNTKIKVGFGLSPTAWLSNARFIAIQILDVATPVLTMAGDVVVKTEIFPRNGVFQNSAELLCGMSRLSYPICSGIVFAFLGYNKYQIPNDTLPVVVGHVPGGTSMKNMVRWGQVKSNGFTEYDYGVIKNMIVYGQMTPPLYDLSKVSMKWVLIASSNDYVADLKDIKLLISKIKNYSLCILSDKTFGHLDFIFGKYLPKYITPIVLSTLETGGYKCL